MKINLRFSTMLGWLLLVLSITMSLAMQKRSANNSDHMYGYVDGVPDRLVECRSCGWGFHLDKDDPLSKMVNKSDNLAVRVTALQSIQVASISFEFIGPAGQQLGQVTQPIAPSASKTQIFHLTKETVQALQAHIGKGNHLKVIVEMNTRTGKDKIQVQMVTLSKVSMVNDGPFGAEGDSWTVSSRSSGAHPIFVPVSNLRQKESAARPSDAKGN